ncbi:zinc finger protein 2-like isoform X2 [Plodia interpunctella]|uniref:zinc finger protein 2-like isoform X2 n=1 Tax=Plodia interpunctella TaxID=58824 RepID=UPI002367F172|nr:zinc finger protein 2-like isoform X2 [Plodia interpunctella]
MALCESQLDSALPQLKREESPSSENSQAESPEKKPKLEHNGAIYGLDKVPAGIPLSVDYRDPVCHFVPPAVEFAARKSPAISTSDTNTSDTGTPVKRKRGRPKIDKTSPEYLANLAARKQAKDMAAVMNNRTTPGAGEKRKRGRPRVDKTSPEYLERKRLREQEALERKAKREYKRRGAGDSAASSSAGDTPRVKRKYTKRNPGTKKSDSTPSGERVKGKRGRPRKDVQLSNNRPEQAKIRVRNNLMPINTEPIAVDSDDEPDLGSPSQASDSLSLDENLRALRHIHEKYANIDKDDLYQTHLLAGFKKPPNDQQRFRDDDEVLSVRSSEGNASVKEADTRVEKLEDSSNSDSDSSSSGSGSSSSGSSSSSSSGSSSSSDSSDSESDSERSKTEAAPLNASPPPINNASHEDERSYGEWSYSGNQSDSDSDHERTTDIPPPQDDISESDNESPDKRFQCRLCRKWYSTRVTLKIHQRSHQNRGSGNSRSRARSSDRYECDCCNETFSRREKLWDHKAKEHRGSMTVRCEVCRKCFEDDAELAAHDRSHTADERAGRCSECGATFSRFDQLRRHRACAHPLSASSGKLPHACSQCGKRFSHAHSLSRHLQNHARQLYRCVVCKASFARADQLAQHLNSHLANYKRLQP